MPLSHSFLYNFLVQMLHPYLRIKTKSPWCYIITGSHQHISISRTKLHPWSNDQQYFIIHNNIFLPPTNYIGHPQLNFLILTLLVAEFPWGWFLAISILNHPGLWSSIRFYVWIYLCIPSIVLAYLHIRFICFLFWFCLPWNFSLIRLSFIQIPRNNPIRWYE